MSFVLVSPSMVIRLNVSDTVLSSAPCHQTGSTLASDRTKESIVAWGGPMFGPIIPAPFAMPATVTSTPPTSMCLMTVFRTVSVVRMASATASSPFSERPLTSAGTASVIRPMGRGWPITPVDETITSSGVIPIFLATREQISWTSAIPSLPVQAFALPLFTTTALA